jgi:hypothetical protein
VRLGIHAKRFVDGGVLEIIFQIRATSADDFKVDQG